MHLVLLEGGAARDPADLPGVASFTAAMVTEGTKTRSAFQLSDELGFLGASLGAGASMDAAYVSGYGLSRHLPRLLELLADVTMNPSFPDSDFFRVQDQRRCRAPAAARPARRHRLEDLREALLGRPPLRPLGRAAPRSRW